MEASAKPKDLKGGKSVYDEHRREGLYVRNQKAKDKENEKEKK